jgi:SET domain-containing protein
MKNYYVTPSKIHGHGIFAARKFMPEEEVGHLVFVVKTKEDNKEYFQTSISPSLKTYLERSELERFLNHSSKPNAKCLANGNEIKLFATRSILKDEEICVNYNDAYRELDKAQIIISQK